MKKRLLLLSAISMLPIMSGCDGFNKPIYNVGYHWDYDNHRYEVYAYNDDYTDHKTYYVNPNNYHFILVDEYKHHLYTISGRTMRVDVTTEYYDANLYVYALK